MNHRALLDPLHLSDLIEPAKANEALTRNDLERLVAARNPFAAAALADLRREAVSGVTVTYPITLRVRAPGLPAPRENGTMVSHAREDAGAAGFEATDRQMVGELPADVPLGHACELVCSIESLDASRPPRMFTADDVGRIAARERTSFASVMNDLARSGLGTLDWRAGADASADAIRIHRAAHVAGLKTFAPVTYSRGGIGPAFLDRLEALLNVAVADNGFVSAVMLPERTEGASPLEGTAGTEDVLACALTRLALGHVVPHVTVDAHVLGHKLAAVLLSCGADDFVGAQAAAAWAPPTDDGPRPLNKARVTKYLIEARRSPVVRDGLFRSETPAAAVG